MMRDNSTCSKLALQTADPCTGARQRHRATCLIHNPEPPCTGPHGGDQLPTGLFVQNLLTLFNVIWPVAVTITPIITGAGIIWLRLQFAPASAIGEINVALTEINGRFEAFESELQRLSENDDSEPTRQQLMNSLSGLAERLSHMEASNESMQRQIANQQHSMERQLGTLEKYLHTLVEHSMKGSQ